MNISDNELDLLILVFNLPYFLLMCAYLQWQHWRGKRYLMTKEETPTFIGSLAISFMESCIALFHPGGLVRASQVWICFLYAYILLAPWLSKEASANPNKPRDGNDAPIVWGLAVLLCIPPVVGARCLTSGLNKEERRDAVSQKIEVEKSEQGKRTK